MNEIAILMAAGKGERLRPITATKPKPLVQVFGVPMIETVINGLNARGVKHIYVVVGYLGEQFEYLTQKYDNVSIIHNTEYNVKNNISSVYAAKNVIGYDDCFICEADLYVSDPSVFKVELTDSCYFGKFVDGYSADWVFTQDGDRIVHIGKGGTDKYNMCGISFFKAKDARTIIDAIAEEYKNEGSDQLFWDEVADKKLNDIYLTVHTIDSDDIIEIDTFAELAEIDPSYKENK